jgi:hypothetical protein
VTVSEGAATIELSGSSDDHGGAPQPVPVTIRIGTGRQGRGEIAARGLATSDRADGTARSAVTVSLRPNAGGRRRWEARSSQRAAGRRPAVCTCGAPAVMAAPTARGCCRCAAGCAAEGKRRDGRDVVIGSGDATAAGAHASYYGARGFGPSPGEIERRHRGVPWR